tara:strand:+ start:234 stop:575 length:342 start_codon:yes stop_codon:yes gene_type:complete
MTDNKRVTNKQILEALKELRLNEAQLNSLATKIVSRMVNIQTMERWYDHVRSAPITNLIQDDKLEMTEEEEALGNAAKYMTLLNLFQDKEEYEKCAICKIKIDDINKILKKYN